MRRELDRDLLMEDWVAAFGFLRDHDTTPRFDPEAAALARARTIAFFNQHLRG